MIFIAGPHKSGSSLLRSLLDDHAALAVVPFETHLMRCFGLPTGYRLRRSAGSPVAGPEIRKRLHEVARSYIDGKELTADADLSNFINHQQLTERAENLNDDLGPDIETVDVLRFLQSAYYLATGDHPRGRTLVEKSVENTELVPSLLALSPSVRVIQIQRHIPTNLASLRRTIVLNRNTYPPIRPLADMLLQTRDLANRNQRLHPERVLTVTYEDLVGNREATMKTLCQFLDLEMHPTLLEPTIMGHPWEANSSRSRMADEQHRRQEQHDEAAERALEQTILDRLDPAVEDQPSRARALMSCLRPAYKERPAAYVLNRIAAFGGEYV